MTAAPSELGPEVSFDLGAVVDVLRRHDVALVEFGVRAEAAQGQQRAGQEAANGARSAKGTTFEHELLKRCCLCG